MRQVKMRYPFSPGATLISKWVTSNSRNTKIPSVILEVNNRSFLLNLSLRTPIILIILNLRTIMLTLSYLICFNFDQNSSSHFVRVIKIDKQSDAKIGTQNL
ncbi:hypothetical protein BDA99DRAFT_530971 [Phascolomyces articulosus]|uniref:Uncharacterized protein n=1 Tax=Phascolomyces articulosus TaxID=60185 RepID=A0AAD5KBK5_9FUNG|nr:hypothetical protein BDA99DRAFT_530971 [Phascolomyces articulosus]